MNVFKQREREFALKRIRALKEKFPESREILSFMERILSYQKDVIEDLLDKDLDIDISSADSKIGKGKPALKLTDINWKPFLGYLWPLLNLLDQVGTGEVREGVSYLKSFSKEETLSNLNYFLEGQMADDVLRFIFMAWLQPILYMIADRIEFNKEQWLKNFCPVCGFRPSVSFITDAEEGEGARFLRCSLCLTDWLYVRTMCVNCGNSEDDKLEYFVDQDQNYIHIQTCKLCGHYIKIVDMRKDGFAVPDLEDIASVSLDLWAQEKGYVKFERNLLGF